MVALDKKARVRLGITDINPYFCVTMHLQSLDILNFKNIKEAHVTFSPYLNCFFGQNGQGKTNVLDAVYFLSFCKSHTNVLDSQVIAHEADFLMLQGLYEGEGEKHEYYCGIKRRQRKVFKHDKKAYERLSEHIGQLPLVMISPGDERLIREGSEERRRFIDMAISQYDPQYMRALVSYTAALQQRNAMLKDEGHHYEDALYELYESQMAFHGEEIFRKRQQFIEQFIPLFNQQYRQISQQQEQVGLSYSSHLSQGPLEPQLQASRAKDRLLGFSTKGIHKDDLDITMDGWPVKQVASQGQCKTCLIAMKLAQAEFLKQKGTHAPILLLDDIFDKLDQQRVENIISLVSQEAFGQIFITDTHYEHLSRILQQSGRPYKVFQIENGDIHPYQTA